MTNHQLIIDDLRAALAVAPGSADDGSDLRDALASYSAAVIEVNERLRRCSELLKQGLRSEAVHEAQEAPNLLEAVAALDFPDRERLERACKRRGFVTPPSLLLAAATELNEAYGALEPIEELLRKHRLLALGRAPLNRRLRVLRELARVDPGNPIWSEDCSAFERRRRADIGKEAQNAAAAGDGAALEALVKELSVGPWLERPEQAEVATVQRLFEAARAGQAHRRATRLADELNRAFSEFDAEGARRLRSAWVEAAETAGLTADDPLVESVQPALDWLAEQDRERRHAAEFARDLAALETALDEQAPLEDLERLGHAVARYERPLPGVLERRYKTRLSEQRDTRRRRARLLLVSVVGLLGLSSAAGGYALWRHHRQSTLASHGQSLAALLDDEKLDEAGQYLARLRESAPWTLDASEIQQLAVRHEGGVQAESVRRANFAQAASAAEQALAANDLDAAAGRAAEARKLARSQSEKQQAERLTTAVIEGETARQRALDERCLADFAPLAATVQGLDAEGKRQASLDAWLTRIRQVQAELEAVAGRHPRASQDVLDQFAPLRLRLVALEKDARQRQATETALNGLGYAVANTADYRRALEEFCERYPESPHAASFRRVLEEAEHWGRLQEWNALAAEWNARLGKPWTDGERAAWSAKAKEWSGREATFPVAADLPPRLAGLEPPSAADDGAPPQAKLETLFNHRIFQNLWLVETKDVKRYYLRERPRQQDDHWAFKYVLDLELLEEKGAILPAAEVALQQPAPHCALAQQALASLNKLTPASWDETFAEILTQTAAAERVDPVLKLIVLKDVLEVGRGGSVWLRDATENESRLLETNTVNTSANWIHPVDRDARDARQGAEKLLAQLAQLPERAQQAAARKREVMERGLPTFTLLGWLRRGGEKWSCARPAGRKVEAGTLFVVKGGPAGMSLQEIGSADAGGAPRLARGASEHLLEGRPVFLLSSVAAGP